VTTGLDEALANLTKLQLNNKKVAREAVDEGAKLFKDILEPNTPRQGATMDEHLQDNIVISGFKGMGEGIFSKDIGYGKAVGYRAKFPDDGTIYQKAQDFKEKTINQATPKVKEIYAKKVKEGLDL